MSIVELFPSTHESLDGFAKHLGISDETKNGAKNPLNVPSELMEFAYNLPMLAMDELTQNDGRIDLAHTFEGAAALCSLVLVHDNPELATLGPALFDGHALLVSLPELNTQMDKGVDHMHTWLRDGCGACAAHALGIQRDTAWTYVSSETLRSIMDKLGVVGWKPNAQQDRLPDWPFVLATSTTTTMGCAKCCSTMWRHTPTPHSTFKFWRAISHTRC